MFQNVFTKKQIAGTDLRMLLVSFNSMSKKKRVLFQSLNAAQELQKGGSTVSTKERCQ